MTALGKLSRKRPICIASNGPTQGMRALPTSVIYQQFIVELGLIQYRQHCVMCKEKSKGQTKDPVRHRQSMTFQSKVFPVKQT